MIAKWLYVFEIFIDQQKSAQEKLYVAENISSNWVIKIFIKATDYDLPVYKVKETLQLL